ncbi:MAG: 30S ribosomal protein S1 [Bdellovibrionota bacterium]
MSVTRSSTQNSSQIRRLFHEEDELEPNSYTEDGKSFEELFESSAENAPIGEGRLAEGKVVSIGSDVVLIDIGLKSEGEVPIAQFKNPEGELEIKVGDMVEVFIERNEAGHIRVSKEKADRAHAWDEITEACESNAILEGTATSVIKGGLLVDIGVKAFLPSSQIDIRPVKNLEQFVGKAMKIRVIKFDPRKGNVVVSRKAVLETEKERLKGETIKILKVGAVVRGIVKNVTDYGAFVDLGGMDGLLHVTDMSWGRVKHPSDIIQVGQEINVRVLKFDAEKERISLGLKQTQPDPWMTIQERFIPGQRVKGVVVSVVDYGAFIEVESGIEGLIHVSEMSWTQKIKDPRKLVNIGEETEAVILDIDLENRRMSLGLKQVNPNPWDSLEHKYPAGTRIKGVIKNITDFGLFVEIEEGIDGLVHVSDLSWDAKISNPADHYQKGDTLDAVVLNVDRENERVSLSVKLLQGDPWQEYVGTHPQGVTVDGTVTKLANFGAFVELAKNIEGMIHVSELSDERIVHPESIVKVGDVVKAEIININLKERKISLSVKSLNRKEEREAMASYQKSDSRSSFSDTMSPEMAAKLAAMLGGAKKEEAKDEE